MRDLEGGGTRVRGGKPMLPAFIGDEGRGGEMTGNKKKSKEDWSVNRRERENVLLRKMSWVKRTMINYWKKGNGEIIRRKQTFCELRSPNLDEWRYAKISVILGS